MACLFFAGAELGTEMMPAGKVGLGGPNPVVRSLPDSGHIKAMDDALCFRL